MQSDSGRAGLCLTAAEPDLHATGRWPAPGCVKPLPCKRNTQQKWFSDELLTIVAKIEKLFKTLFDPDIANLEYWQATHYPQNGGFTIISMPAPEIHYARSDSDATFI